MNVRSILQAKGAHVHTAGLETPLRNAARRLDDLGVGALVAVDEAGRGRGVFSERDLAREVARQGAGALDLPISAAMSRSVVTAAPSDTVDALMERMTNQRIRHLPVLEGGRLAGIVSIGDVVKAKIELAESEARAMRDYITAG